MPSPFQVFPNAVYNIAAFTTPRDAIGDYYQTVPGTSFGMLSSWSPPTASAVGNIGLPYFALSGSGVFGGVSAIGVLYDAGQFSNVIRYGATTVPYFTAGTAFFRYAVTVQPVTGANVNSGGDTAMTLVFQGSAGIPAGALMAVELGNRTFNTFQIVSGSSTTVNVQLSDFGTDYSSPERQRRIAQTYL